MASFEAKWLSIEASARKAFAPLVAGPIAAASPTFPDLAHPPPRPLFPSSSLIYYWVFLLPFL